MEPRLEAAESDIIDMPKLYEYFGHVLVQIFLNAPNDERRQLFIRLLHPCFESDKAIVIMRFVLDYAVKLKVSFGFFFVFCLQTCALVLVRFLLTKFYFSLQKKRNRARTRWPRGGRPPTSVGRTSP